MAEKTRWKRHLPPSLRIYRFLHVAKGKQEIILLSTPSKIESKTEKKSPSPDCRNNKVSKISLANCNNELSQQVLVKQPPFMIFVNRTSFTLRLSSLQFAQRSRIASARLDTTIEWQTFASFELIFWQLKSLFLFSLSFFLTLKLLFVEWSFTTVFRAMSTLAWPPIKICSRKKKYSFGRTHKLFCENFSLARNEKCNHFVSVTYCITAMASNGVAIVTRMWTTFGIISYLCVRTVLMIFFIVFISIQS